MDLHPNHNCNILVKYADDMYLLIGSNHLLTASNEFKHISVRAVDNNLHLNPTKTRELIAFRKGRKVKSCPGTTHVSSLHVLGVTIGFDLGMEQHLNEVNAFAQPVHLPSTCFGYFIHMVSRCRQSRWSHK